MGCRRRPGSPTGGVDDLKGRRVRRRERVGGELPANRPKLVRGAEIAPVAVVAAGRRQGPWSHRPRCSAAALHAIMAMQDDHVDGRATSIDEVPSGAARRRFAVTTPGRGSVSQPRWVTN
jgi:hypothetical protein